MKDRDSQMLTKLLILFPLAAGLALPAVAQDAKHNALPSEFGTFGDNGLPFFGQTLDARALGPGWPADNLTPRGIILNPGGGVHACFDPDLLRMALVWRENSPGEFLTMNGMAPGSYRLPHRKAPAGQDDLPAPLGTPILANGLHPGWQIGGGARRVDPRERSIDAAEPGLGPVSGELGRWIGLKLERQGPTLVYEVGGTRIEDWLQVVAPEGALANIFRRLWIAPHDKALTLFLSPEIAIRIEPVEKHEQIFVELFGPNAGEVVSRRLWNLENVPAPKPVDRFWKEEVRVAVAPPPSPAGPFAIEAVPLPVPNPWKRNVRPASFDFFPDGRLALVTFDGDVWIADGVEPGRTEITWRRFAGGLHEPMTLRIVDGHILVFGRNGLVRLVDRDGNGEADFHENVASLAAQTAETREFALGFEPMPGGGYYLAKGGQVASTRGKLNGTIVTVTADGSALDVVATGLRQPFIGLDPKTGLLTASDQQGHWVPATPLHVIEPGSYYGFQPSQFGAEAVHPAPIVDPPLWIPHFVNQSGARQVWLRDAKMGPLNDSLIHLGYNRPGLFKVYLDHDGPVRQGAIEEVLEGFSTGILDGRVSPRDGFLYVGGLNIWGTAGAEVRGLFRVRPTGQPCWIPEDVRSFDKGILMRFSHELDEAIATSRASYTVDRWNYRRTHNYGSGHFKLDGSPGQESLPVSAALLSQDGKSVFLGIPGMRSSDTLRVTYRVATVAPAPVIRTAYLTVRQLRAVDLPALGFPDRDIDLTVKGPAAADLPRPEPSAAEGKNIATRFGCIACHTTDGSKAVNPEPTMVVGPTWKGLYGSKREFTDGTVVKKADEVYLREAILNPSRKVTKGFETETTGVGMPPYLGVLRDDQVESIILYIKQLAR